jgi:predicted ArsR family transcriptional regulator
MIIYVDYASPSLLDSTADTTNVAVAANMRRPVRFHGRVRDHGFILRIALRALGELIWSNDMWYGEAAILDPVITVHPDRVFFEAFSQDQSVYGALIVDPNLFETMGEVITGTTNIDFSAWLWGALGEMRTSRSTTFRIGPEGFEVKTSSAGGRFEKKVDLPESWVRGFLQVQAAMGLPGTRVNVKPIDLLAALRMLRHTKAKVSPRGLRYEFEPGQDVKLVLEPWEHTVTFEGATHNYTEHKTTRVWGRRRLKLIEGLLPFADGVDIYLKGRALPSFYAVKLPGMTFLLGLTGWSGSGFTGTGGFDLLATGAAEDEPKLPAAVELLKKSFHVSIDQLADALGVDKTAASRILVRLCRQGRAMFDVEARNYRHRELFETPADEATYFPPDLRQERAHAILEKGDAKVTSCSVEETRKVRNLRDPAGDSKKEKIAREIVYRDWRVIGEVENQKPVEIAVNDNGRIIFGRCTCPFFADNLMNQGPCEHMLALFKASESDRTDQPSSMPADPSALGEPTRKQPSRWEVDSGRGDE